MNADKFNEFREVVYTQLIINDDENHLQNIDINLYFKVYFRIFWVSAQRMNGNLALTLEDLREQFEKNYFGV